MTHTHHFFGAIFFGALFLATPATYATKTSGGYTLTASQEDPLSANKQHAVSLGIPPLDTEFVETETGNSKSLNLPTTVQNPAKKSARNMSHRSRSWIKKNKVHGGWLGVSVLAFLGGMSTNFLHSSFNAPESLNATLARFYSSNSLEGMLHHHCQTCIGGVQSMSQIGAMKFLGDVTGRTLDQDNWQCLSRLGDLNNPQKDSLLEKEMEAFFNTMEMDKPFPAWMTEDSATEKNDTPFVAGLNTTPGEQH